MLRCTVRMQPSFPLITTSKSWWCVRKLKDLIPMKEINQDRLMRSKFSKWPHSLLYNKVSLLDPPHMRTETATGANQLRYLVQVPFFPLHKLSNSMTISTRNSPFMPVPASKKYTKKDILILHCLIKANMTPPQVMTLSGVPHSTLLFPLKTAR
jgi:hypothetical protein